MHYLIPLLVLTFTAATTHAQTVAVDVGHYTAAPGATSARGRPELEFNRDLARDIAAAIATAGLATRLIGEDGGMARLTDRSRAARGSALLLSVHHDSVQPHFLQPWITDGAVRLYSDHAEGFSLFISAKNPHPAKSLECAAAIGAALRAGGFVHSPHHAERIPGEMKRYADRVNGVHFYDNLVVLKTAQQPAVLIEAGVIVHRDDELRVSEPRWRAGFAKAVAGGVTACLIGAGKTSGARGPDFDRPAE